VINYLPVAFLTSRLGGELLRLDELLDSLLSESLELPELEPELDLDERFARLFTRAKAAATANLLRARSMSFEGAGGLAALTRIIPNQSDEFSSNRTEQRSLIINKTYKTLMEE